MSEEFEVHGPHDHAVEHAAQGGDSMASRVAVMTAVLATVGAMVSYQSGNAENLALFYKNEAAIRKTEAADQWAYYQAKSEKQDLAELGAALSAQAGEQHDGTTARFGAEVLRYKSEKDVIRKRAEGLEAEVVDAEQKSERLLHQHHRWAQSMMTVQISIALAAITLLVRRRWLQYCTYGAAGAGITLAALAVLNA
ncbi:MAG: DUF4337 domain-containing protein [Pararobbsia sp.]